jgi:hypothetical protein
MQSTPYTRPTVHQARHGSPARLRQRGLSLMDLILFLGLIALIIAGVLALFSQADTSARTSELLKGVAGLNANIRSLYSGQSGYDEPNMVPTLIKANAVPSNWVKGNVLVNGYGGSVTVTGNGSNFVIGLQRIPNDACIRFLSEQSSVSWSVMEANGQKFTQLPMKVADATASCNAGTNNAIVLTSQ